MLQFQSKFLLCAALFFFSGIIAVEVKAQDPKLEEILAKHLESIGTKEKRAAVKNQMAAGTSQFESKQPNRKTGGKAIIVSNSLKNLFFVSSFNSQEYPFEKIGYFNGKTSLPFVTSGTRSPLGAFLADHSKILSETLLAGSISSAWTLLDPQFKKTKLSADGTKKIDGRKTYVLAYYPENSAGKFTVKLFFDAETFRHVRTQYRDEVQPRDQPFGTLGIQAGVKLDMIEIFSDFKDAGEGLTLPHSYKIQYVTDSNSGTYEYNWGITISKYLFNQNLAADFFTFEEKK